MLIPATGERGRETAPLRRRPCPSLALSHTKFRGKWTSLPSVVAVCKIRRFIYSSFVCFFCFLQLVAWGHCSLLLFVFSMLILRTDCFTPLLVSWRQRQATVLNLCTLSMSTAPPPRFSTHTYPFAYLSTWIYLLYPHGNYNFLEVYGHM